MLPDGGLYFCQKKKKMLVQMKTVQNQYIRAQIWLWISTSVPKAWLPSLWF